MCVCGCVFVHACVCMPTHMHTYIFEFGVREYNILLVLIFQRMSTYTVWRKPIGCLELQVIFRKRATNYGALLRKMTYKQNASYGSSPPCIHIYVFEFDVREYKWYSIST